MQEEHHVPHSYESIQREFTPELGRSTEYTTVHHTPYYSLEEDNNDISVTKFLNNNWLN